MRVIFEERDADGERHYLIDRPLDAVPDRGYVYVKGKQYRVLTHDWYVGVGQTYETPDASIYGDYVVVMVTR